MYGMNTTLNASAAVMTSSGLAYVGLNIGATLLTVLGVALICVALVALFRPDSKARP